MHHFSRCPSVIQNQLIESCRSTITIKNLLHFLKYFDENNIFMKNFLLGCVKFPSTHLSSGFFASRSIVAKENGENTIKLNASSNSRTLYSLHQVNIMLLELVLRMLLYFSLENYL